VAEIGIEFNETDKDMVEKWRSGRYDVMHTFFEAAEGTDTVVEMLPGLGTIYTGFRADAPPFDDVRVRRAFAHALDRERFAEIFGLHGEPALHGGFLPPAMPAHSHRVAPEHDLERARSLLAEAGYPEGKGLPEIVLEFYEGHPRALIEEHARQWSQLGARVRAEAPPLEQIGLRGAQAWSFGWIADFPDPRGMLDSFLDHHQALYRDDEIRALLERASVVRDQVERLRLYGQVEQRLIGEHAALVPLVYNRVGLVRRSWVDGVWAAAVTPFQLDQAVVSPRPDSAPRRS
jgi:oligopeptide transport system substrate-binding protein